MEKKRGDPPGGSGIHMDWHSLVSPSFKIIGFLGLVIVLSVLLVRFSKRGFNAHRPRVCLKIVDSLPLGRDKVLCVVEAGRSILLLGLTNNSVSLLKEFSPEEIEEMSNQEEGSNPKDKTTFFAKFAESLGERMDKSRNPKKMCIRDRYGEYYPIESNETAEGRQKNRRVDIVILRPSLSSAEPNR